MPEAVIRELAGHLDPTMTHWYSRSRLAAKRAAVEALSAEPALPLEPVKRGGSGGSYDTNHDTKLLSEGKSEPKLLNEWRAWGDSNARPLVPEMAAIQAMCLHSITCSSTHPYQIPPYSIWDALSIDLNIDPL